jgi:trypsin-like peptidase
MVRPVLAFGVLIAALGFTPAVAFPRFGDPAVTQLWTDDAYVCTATFIEEHNGLSWVVSAAHCADEDSLLSRDKDAPSRGVVNWRLLARGHVAIERVYDVALGTVPDMRSTRTYHVLSAMMPRHGVVYAHGFPRGVERVATLSILGDSDELPGMVVLLAAPNEIEVGFSGSAVFNDRDELVGIVSRARVEHHEQDPPDAVRVYVTPVEVIHRLMDVMGLEASTK